MMEVWLLLLDKENKVDIGKTLLFFCLSISSFLLISLLFSLIDSDGIANQSLFDEPYGITVNPEDGSIYINEYTGYRIRKLFRLHWTKERHSQFPLSIRIRISTIMKMSTRIGSKFSKLPRDILFVIIQILSLIDNCEQMNEWVSPLESNTHRIPV